MRCRGHSAARPVLLGTLSVRVDPTAERMAIDSALESGAKLILANMLVLPPYPLTFKLAPEYATLPHEDDRDAVRAHGRARGRARNRDGAAPRVEPPPGDRVARARTASARPGCLVFGPDLPRRSALRVREGGATVRRDAPCLVWIAPTGELIAHAPQRSPDFRSVPNRPV